jgi:hypothetical protein
MHLQTLVLALGGAGLGTCRAAAAIKQDQHLILMWASSRLDCPLSSQKASEWQCLGSTTDATPPVLSKLIEALLEALASARLGAAHMLLAYIDEEISSGRLGAEVDPEELPAHYYWSQTCQRRLEDDPVKVPYDTCYSTLKQAAKLGHCGMVALILDNFLGDLSPESRSWPARGALIWAAHYGQTKVLELLLPYFDPSMQKEIHCAWRCLNTIGSSNSSTQSGWQADPRCVPGLHSYPELGRLLEEKLGQDAMYDLRDLPAADCISSLHSIWTQAEALLIRMDSSVGQRAGGWK